jgi:hypothetical protein
MSMLMVVLIGNCNGIVGIDYVKFAIARKGLRWQNLKNCTQNRITYFKNHTSSLFWATILDDGQKL